MYHAVVRGILRNAFAALNRGDHGPVLGAFAEKHRHVFYGSHAMAGVRTNMTDTRAWYARLSRLLPDLRFDITDISVSGWPWDTVAFVEWTDHFTVDGQPDFNQGVHVLRLSWGKVTSLAVYCDTQKLADVLARKAKTGVSEALAAPIGQAA